ncbi:MAG: hypothetical protein CO029_05045 [Candidatus Magasanikbacteria bacterium CG_4_9_14_0_2_um_filter_41_10]|uniref:Uncharacterized protein n=1 Tax=Candidatus Magasanikbacteria bacterium CG_4_10_14_0_2_um_filter_41_31 TaxID=1974639 RepID=A0A2M7V3N2_9BACT|nr:MAG: hypothetical protein AUJ37_00190 [Candidatus Magasanikbacteria bacterium CG1_02_41_34]PIZ93098.1 MAG: hypothetical protein COX83_02720 [Candidatus Magasanikbacteria bacterium CG_4_10_14_0_2_um_filter_41_31]PJC53000.1 MAG: hypothetical protein CO029_05045 [Candidatus Magasanikbacteria bacterium CG_4_9_14_0_2_um_filter_41_10]
MSTLDSIQQYQPFGEMGNVKPVLEKLHAALERTKKESPVLSQVKEVVQLLQALKLEQEYEEDPRQRALLQISKNQAETLISRVLDDLQDYVERINAMERHIKMLQFRGLSGRDIAERIADLDDLRRNAHNALIASLHAATRFLSTTFGEMSENRKEEWEDEQEELDQEVLHVQRVDFPGKVLVPSHVDLQDRKQITAWAVDLYNAMTEIV